MVFLLRLYFKWVRVIQVEVDNNMDLFFYYQYIHITIFTLARFIGCY